MTSKPWNNLAPGTIRREDIVPSVPPPPEGSSIEEEIARVPLPYVVPKIDSHGAVHLGLRLPLIGDLQQGRATDAGWDMFASEDTTLFPDCLNRVPTGVRIKISTGFYARILPRSSAILKGINVLDGTIDAGYTGELFVICTWSPKGHDGEASYPVKKGDRIAQLIFSQMTEVEFVPVEVIDATDLERGEDGFGSTGQ